MPEGTTIEGQTTGTPGTEPPAAAPEGASLTLSADLVRNSPEYRALQRQMREQAREQGRILADATKAREEAEAARQVAETARQQALAEQLEGLLGADGVTAFNEIAELSESDPVEAARKFREFAASVGQTPPPAPGTGEPPAATGAPTVPEQQQSANEPPPPPGTGVSGDAPLGQQPGIDWDGIVANETKRYAETVARNQDPITRNRVTEKERGGAFMAWLAASYVKGLKQLGRLPKI